MRKKQWIRGAAVFTTILAISLWLGGCLECQESILGRYDADKDQFVFLNLYQGISGTEAGDPDYVEKLWNNRNHLITAPLPSFLGNKLSYLRLLNGKVAVLNLGSPKPVEVQLSPLPLDQIKIEPGQFFLRGQDQLCYYDQITVPGPFLDNTLKVMLQDMGPPLTHGIKEELDRRKNGGKPIPWEHVRKELFQSIRQPENQDPATAPSFDSKTPHAKPASEPRGVPAPGPTPPECGVLAVQTTVQIDDPAATTPSVEGPQSVLSEKSLQQLSNAIADGSLKITRDKSVFSIMVPLDNTDTTESLATIKAIREAIAEQLKKPVHDPDNEKAAALLEIINARTAPAGRLLLSLDAVKLFPVLQKIMDPLAAPPAPDEATTQRRRAMVDAIKAKSVPIDSRTTTEQILRDFHAGTLKGHPSEKPVPPGEGLVETK